ncbi:uncharacterized protein LOC135493584 [Lineus longissimus]|uniref:uncharacterized protein LOC135493584 n=1 Tax=Lineus longissimus TaxID=88925 RepID=UPI00315D073C
MAKLRRKNKTLPMDTEIQASGTCTHAGVPASPATKAEQLVKTGDKDEIKKQLTFGFVVQSGIKNNRNEGNSRSRKKKNVIVDCAKKLLKKYRMIEKAEKELSVSRRQLRKRRNEINESLHLNEGHLKPPSAITKLVIDFFHRDDVSRPASGKRETITLKKEKRQKRYQCDTLKNLRFKFLAENPNLCISYTSFTRLRPFYVVPPNLKARNTTACKLHANCELLANKLWQLKILKTDNIHDIVESIVCSPSELKCMYLKCESCKDGMRNIYTDLVPQSFPDPIDYYQWQSKTEIRSTTKGQEISVNVHCKDLLHDTVKNVCDLFETKLKELMPHQFRVHHQYSQIRNLRSSITPDECVLQVDFSENYECKLSKEIMSMHFGASKRQISLHTCHVAFHNSVKCYCTLSSDTRHGAAPIWAHLNPVLNDIRARGVKKLHFVSDGPTSQYRNRTNFCLLSNIPFHLGFEFVSWNFLESGHGKGPADGVGATIKNAADRAVAYGRDVSDLESMLKELDGNLNVKLFVVTTEDMSGVESSLDGIENEIKSVKGTLKIHQIHVASPGCFRHRTLSCYCKGSCGVCTCHSPEQIEFPIIPNSSQHSSTAIEKIEAQLSMVQKNLFEKRLIEEFDVVVDDLSTLSPEQQQEYMLWKVWRSEKGNNHCTEVPENIETTVVSEEKEPSHASELRLEEQNFYAVLFTRGQTRNFYIGRLIDILIDEENVKIKFLERVGSRTQHTYDWPRRDDILTVEKKFIIDKVVFDGPPPFTLDSELATALTKMMLSMGKEAM